MARFVASGIAPCSSTASMYARRSSELSWLSAACARCGLALAFSRSSFFTALASSGFCRSSAARDMRCSPLPSSGTFIRNCMVERRYLPPAIRPRMKSSANSTTRISSRKSGMRNGENAIILLRENLTAYHLLRRPLRDV